MTDDSIEMRAANWIVGGDTGISSKAIWANMMGCKPDSTWGSGWPLDPDDFGRCARLLKLIPEWRQRLPEMAAKSETWALLVAHWDEIHNSMEDEVGIDWSKGQRATKTYNLMQRIRTTTNA